MSREGVFENSRGLIHSCHIEALFKRLQCSYLISSNSNKRHKNKSETYTKMESSGHVSIVTKHCAVMHTSLHIREDSWEV